MKLSDPTFIPVTAKRLTKGFWIAQTPDKKLAWFGKDSLAAVTAAQVCLGQRAASNVVPFARRGA